MDIFQSQGMKGVHPKDAIGYYLGFCNPSSKRSARV